MTSPFYRNALPLLALLGLLLGTVAGCGGGGGGGNRASAAPTGGNGGNGGTGGSAPIVRTATLQYTVEWPDRTRAMPLTANSAVVTVAVGDQVVATRTFNRPAGADGASADGFLFAGLPAGPVTVAVAAYSQPSGGGTVLARGTETPVLLPGQQTQGRVALASTATTLAIGATPLTVAQGETGTLTVTARDAQGALVPLRVGAAGDRLVWSSDAEGVASVTGTGEDVEVRGGAPGTATVSASFQVDDAGRTIHAQATVTVAAPITGLASLEISPVSRPNPGHAPVQFTAIAVFEDGTMRDVTDAVAWSVLPISTGRTATIGASGLLEYAPGGGEESATYVDAVFGGKTSNVAAVYAYF